MKKVITAVVLSLVLLVNTAFANPIETVNDKVAAAFKQEFAHATNVNWQKTESYYKASFKINAESVNAYFTTEGEMMGLTHNIVSTQLPINLQSSIKKSYADYWISDLFEYVKTDSNGYYVTLENADYSITLQSENGTAWSVYSKVKKQ